MGQQELRLQTAIARLFARGRMGADPAMVARYIAVAESFGTEYVHVGLSTEGRARFADSLIAAGVLERRVIQLSRDGQPCGSRFEYRRIQPQAVAA